jgi:hypothetical protein
MKLPIKYLVLSVFMPLCFSVASSAQSNYKPGFIVMPKGDTVKGYVDYREWDNNPAEVRFKLKAGNTEPEKILPENVLAFGITGLEYYESYSLRISQGQTDVARLPVGVDTSALIAQVFLLRTATGKNVSLYSYKDAIKTRFFIKDHADKKPEELIYQVYLNPSEVTQIVNQPRFQNQLYLLALKYAPDDHRLQRKIELTEYDQPELLAVVNAINRFTPQQVRAAAVKSTRYFAGLGVSRSMASYRGNIALAENATGNASYSPVAGMGVDLFVNPNVKRLLLRLELSFETAGYTTTTRTPLYARHAFDQFTGSLTPQLIYNLYDTDAFKFFLGAGVSFNFSHYGHSTYTFADEPYSGTTEEEKNYPQMVNSWISFSGKAGAVFNNGVELFIGYSPYAIVTDHYETLSGSVNGAQFGVHYLFR